MDCWGKEKKKETTGCKQLIQITHHPLLAPSSHNLFYSLSHTICLSLLLYPSLLNQVVVCVFFSTSFHDSWRFGCRERERKKTERILVEREEIQGKRNEGEAVKKGFSWKERIYKIYIFLGWRKERERGVAEHIYNERERRFHHIFLSLSPILSIIFFDDDYDDDTFGKKVYSVNS